MAFWQVVEKVGFGSSWSLVRYTTNVMDRLASQELAKKAAIQYLTKRNYDNALTLDEKRSHFEVFMMTDEGVLLGEVDGKPWYLQYPKDITHRDGEKKGETQFLKNDKVRDRKWYELDGKVEVSVSQVPGT